MKNNSCIQLPNNDECAFCAYLEGRRPYTILMRDERTATFVTREQRGVAHLLVVPIRHASTILDLEDLEIAALAIQVKKVANLITERYCREGIAVWQNNGISARQMVGHVHFHVAGTLDQGGTEFGPVEEISLEETENIARELLKNIV